MADLHIVDGLRHRICLTSGVLLAAALASESGFGLHSASVAGRRKARPRTRMSAAREPGYERATGAEDASVPYQPCLFTLSEGWAVRLT